MSDQTNGDARRLTLEDPVPPETLAAFRQIKGAQSEIGLELMALEERKIQLLAGNKKLREQHDRLFHAILMERGLPPQTPVEIDGKSGRVLVRTPEAPSPEPAP